MIFAGQYWHIRVAPSRPEPQAVTAVHGDLWQRDATASGLTSTWRRADGRTYWAG